jgi:hypothetical protein
MTSLADVCADSSNSTSSGVSSAAQYASQDAVVSGPCAT